MTQLFKSIYFPKYGNYPSGGKSFTLAFSEREYHLFEALKNSSSLELRNLLSSQTFEDLKTLADAEHLAINTYCIWKLSKELKNIKKAPKNGERLEPFNINPIHVTFEGGKNLPLQSWYSYLEGYSPDFVEYIINNHLIQNTKTIYDPFSGSGTTPLVASSLKYAAYYSEINPLLQFLSQTKFKARNIKDRKKIISRLSTINNEIENEILACDEDVVLHKNYLKTFKKSRFFEDKVFSNLLRTKTYLRKLSKFDSLTSDLVSTAVLGSLIKVSLLKRQGDLRYKTRDELSKTKTVEYFETIRANLQNIINDIPILKKSSEPIFLSDDARKIQNLDRVGIDAVITSPPYLNGTNYFRNTKLELWFLGHLKSLDDLTNFRKQAVTAGINDVSLKSEKLIENKLLEKLLKEINKSAYDRRIPKMIHDYFADMQTIFKGLKKHLNDNAVLAIDLGDSVYSNVHVKTDEILISILKQTGYKFEQSIVLRRRVSKNGKELRQVLLIFRYIHRIKSTTVFINELNQWDENWNKFKKELPHQQAPLSKRNWGDPLHSLCSYQGKLKPSIANMLVSIFVPSNGSVLDIFAGVGTVPLEAALQGKKSYGFDISNPAVAISRAKLSKVSKEKTSEIIQDLEKYILNGNTQEDALKKAQGFGFNKKLVDYFHPNTLKEILLAREYFKTIGFDTPEKSIVFASILHILHGNRPYALSRRSHGITPFAPSGEFEYKNLIIKLKEKINRSLQYVDRKNFIEGSIYFQNALKTWPKEIKSLDAIITSPPFFDSTRFYLSNWMRIWFAGWDEINFKTDSVDFMENLQKKDFSVYDSIFKQARERLKMDGVFILHLGKSNKCDMAKVLSEKAKPWFNTYDIFEESVRTGESHGVTDKGTVVDHQYLILN